MNEPNPTPEPSDPPPDFRGVNQPSYAQTLFFGPEGLRPGWGFVFYFAMYYPLQVFAVGLAWSRDLGASGLWSGLLEEFGVLLAALIPTLILAVVEQRPWGSYGMPLRLAFGRLYWVGAVWGFAAISLLLLSLSALHTFRFGHVVLHGLRIAKFGVFWALMFLLVGLAEEFRFRGYTQFALGRAIGFWPAGIAMSAMFGLVHRGNQGESWIGVLGALAIGLFFCLTLRRTGSLWFAVGFHAAWDWGQTFFYSVPDSGTVWPGHLLHSALNGPNWLTGGTVGPEGSLLCFVVIAVVWVAFNRVYPKVRSSTTPELSIPNR